MIPDSTCSSPFDVQCRREGRKKKHNTEYLSKNHNKKKKKPPVRIAKIAEKRFIEARELELRCGFKLFKSGEVRATAMLAKGHSQSTFSKLKLSRRMGRSEKKITKGKHKKLQLRKLSEKLTAFCSVVYTLLDERCEVWGRKESREKKGSSKHYWREVRYSSDLLCCLDAKLPQFFFLLHTSSSALLLLLFFCSVVEEKATNRPSRWSFVLEVTAGESDLVENAPNLSSGSKSERSVRCCLFTQSG